jgi:hypothetical protein
LSGLSRFEIANIELYLFNSNNLKKNYPSNVKDNCHI